jgi:hypothetical protein
MLDRIFDREMPYYFKPIEKVMTVGITITSFVLMYLTLNGTVGGVSGGWTLMGLSAGSLIVGNMRFIRSDELRTKKEKYEFALDVIAYSGMMIIGILGGLGMISGTGIGVTITVFLGAKLLYKISYPFIVAAMEGKNPKTVFSSYNKKFKETRENLNTARSELRGL